MVPNYSLSNFYAFIAPHFSLLALSAFILGIISYPAGYFFVFIALFFLVFLVICKNNERLKWYLIICFLLFGLGFFLTKYQIEKTKLPEKFFQNSSQIQIKVISQVETKNQKWQFEAKELNLKTKLLVSCHQNSKFGKPKYGDLMTIEGRFFKAPLPTNPGQFNYQNYLTQHGFSAIFYAEHILAKKPGLTNPFKKLAFSLKEKILTINKSTLPYPYSDLYTSLVFGDYGLNLPDEISQNFQKTGLTHLLVVSGAQVALLAGILNTIFLFLGLKPGLNFVLITLINTIFFFLTGQGTSVLRAILMTELGLGIKLVSRRASIYHIMAITALIMLFLNPLNLFNIGTLLSFAATFALLFGAEKISQVLPKSWPKFLNQTLGVTLAPFIFTTPLLWLFFQQISLISILSNLIVINWIEILVITGFFSTLIGFIFLPLTQLINNFSLLLMWILNKITNYLAQLPLSVIYLKMPHIILIVIIYILIFFFLETLSRKKYTWLKISCLICGIFIVIISIFIILPTKFMTVTFLDVGQGDAVLIETPKHKSLLIDAGPIITGFRTNEILLNLGKTVIGPCLRAKGINKLDLIVLSHFHQDHYGGLGYLIENFPVGVILNNNHFGEKLNLVNSLKQKKMKMLPNYSHAKIDLEPNISLESFYPTSNYHNLKDENENSIICKLTFKQVAFLFTGDAKETQEQLLVNSIPDKLKAQVLKIGHHGSKTSTCELFLATVKPNYAIICVGENVFHHPSFETINRLKKYHSKILRLDQTGAVTFKTDGEKIYLNIFKKPSNNSVFN